MIEELDRDYGEGLLVRIFEKGEAAHYSFFAPRCELKSGRARSHGAAARSAHMRRPKGMASDRTDPGQRLTLSSGQIPAHPGGSALCTDRIVASQERRIS